MYLVTNANKGPRGFYANRDGGMREHVTVPAGGSIEIDLSEKQVTKLKSWEGLSFELIDGTKPGPEPKPAEVTEDVHVEDISAKPAKDAKAPKAKKAKPAKDAK